VSNTIKKTSRMTKNTIPQTPLSLRECFPNGKLNIALYHKYKRRKRKRRGWLQDDYVCFPLEAAHKRVKKLSQQMNRIHIRSVKKHETYFRDVDGSIRAFLPTDTLWYKLYCKGEPQNNRLKMMFRKRFRMPHNSFVSICNDISKNKIFDRWRYHDAVGKPSLDLMLLLLGFL